MNHRDDAVESALARYRPAGPRAQLRDDILRSATPDRVRWAIAEWLSAAAVVLLAVGLHSATRQSAREIIAMLGDPRPAWRAAADEAAELLNGDGLERRYMIAALAAGRHRSVPLPWLGTATGLSGDVP